MPFTKLPINNLSNSFISTISTLSSSNSSNSSPKTNKKKFYPIIDLFLIYHENSLLNLHDQLIDKYNNLGYLNKSTSENFINLLLDNIIIEDYNIYNNDNSIKNDENIEYYDYNYDDSNYN